MPPVTGCWAGAVFVVICWTKANTAAPTGWAVGSCADNALAEGFFGMLKRERVSRRRYFTRAEARSDIFDYIERFYNPRMRRRLQRMENQEIELNPTVRRIGA